MNTNFDNWKSIKFNVQFIDDQLHSERLGAINCKGGQIMSMKNLRKDERLLEHISRIKENVIKRKKVDKIINQSQMAIVGLIKNCKIINEQERKELLADYEKQTHNRTRPQAYNYKGRLLNALRKEKDKDKEVKY